MKKRLLNAQPIWFDGLFLVRVMTGVMIIPFGWEIFNEGNMRDLENMLRDYHFPLPKQMAYLAKLSELVGGIFLILGLFTKLVSIPLGICMIVVIYTTAGGSIFDGGFSFLFLLLFVNFMLLGAGKWSLDYLIFDRKTNQLNKS